MRRLHAFLGNYLLRTIQYVYDSSATLIMNKKRQVLFNVNPLRGKCLAFFVNLMHPLSSRHNIILYIVYHVNLFFFQSGESNPKKEIIKECKKRKGIYFTCLNFVAHVVAHQFSIT